MTIKINDLVGTWAASPPILYYQLRKALDNSESSFTDLSDIISADPSLSAKLLKVVNSAFYGFSSQVETLTHALNIIGTDQLVDLAMATVVVSKFQGIPRDLINMESFWMHSIATGIAARKFAEYRGDKNSDRLYLAGMLHDIGSLVIFKESPDVAKDILARCKAEPSPRSQVEWEMLGFDHAEVGSKLLEGWELPKRLVEIVAYHHKPLESENFSLDACIVHMADALIYEMGIGNSGEHAFKEADPNVVKMVNLPEDALPVIKDEIASMVDETVRMFM